jgi:bifunctional non-homologous end joining protein LigD
MDKKPTAVPREQPKPSLGKSERFEFTHVDKMMFPEAGLTKGDILAFYSEIADHLLPHLKDRPTTLERLPDGLTRPNAPRFWQKNTPAYYPSWVPRVELPTETGKPVQYVLVNDLDTLLYLVSQGTITFHPFLSRVQSLDHPDFVLFDLDPGEATFADAVKIARTFHKLLEGQRIESYLKTSGKSGLHVLTPWAEKGGYDEARHWASTIAAQLVEALPDVATVERSKAARGKRVYVDVIQNARGHHVVPPYAIRAVPEATVSTPLD